MGIVSILLLVICMTSAVVLAVVILLQDEEGEGFGGLFGGASSTAFGSRSGNVLTKFTSIIAAVFMFGTFSLAWINRTPESGNIVRRARMESLRAAEDDWWIQVEQNSSQGEESGPADETENPQVSPKGGTEAESGVIRAGETEGNGETESE